MYPFAMIETGSVVVAVSLVALVGIITIVAMFKFNVDGVIKIWAMLGTLVGLITGSMATYFFTGEIRQQEMSKYQAEVQAVAAKRDAVVAEKESLNTELQAVASRESQLKADILQLATGKPFVFFDSQNMTNPAFRNTDPKERQRWMALLQGIRQEMRRPDESAPPEPEKEGDTKEKKANGEPKVVEKDAPPAKP